MTVDEAIEWLESAKRQHGSGGQEIGDYPLMLHGRVLTLVGEQHVESTHIDLRVDNGRSVVYIMKEEM